MKKQADVVYKEVGQRIAKARSKQGLTQEGLAARSDVAATHIGFIEQGRRHPTLSTLCKLTDALNITLEELFRKL